MVTYVEFLEQGSVGDSSAVLLYGFPELLLSRVAIHRTDLEPAVCTQTSHHAHQRFSYVSVHHATQLNTHLTTPTRVVRTIRHANN